MRLLERWPTRFAMWSSDYTKHASAPVQLNSVAPTDHAAVNLSVANKKPGCTLPTNHSMATTVVSASCQKADPSQLARLPSYLKVPCLTGQADRETTR